MTDASCFGVGFCILTVNGVKRGDDSGHLVTRQTVMDCLCFSSGLDKTVLAQPCKVLRQGRLAQAQHGLQGRDRLLALLQLAQDHQAVFVGHGFQQSFGCFGAGLECC